MRLELTGRHLTITTPMRRQVQRRLAHLERLLNSSAISSQVVITREKTRMHVEMTLHARGERFLHGEATGRDWELALSAAADKVERQAQTLKSKRTERRRQGISAAKAGSAAPRPERAARVVGTPRPEPSGGDGELRIIRARRYEVKPMTIDEAAMEVDEGHGAFLVFRNADTEAVTVLFRRPDGNLGLIEPEA